MLLRYCVNLIELYNSILYRPLFNAVIFLYNIIPGNDFGLAVIGLTVLIRFLFSPLSIKAIRSQRSLNKINPALNEIKDKFKNDAQAQSAAIMQFYKENNINPLAGCLPLLIQLPILIALYQAFGAGFKQESLALLYSFIDNPGNIQPISLGFLDVTTRNIILALITGAFQFIQLKQNSAMTKLTGPKLDQKGQQKDIQALNTQMLYFFPIIIIIIGWNLPAGLLLYWITTTLFSIGEQYYIKERYRD